MEPKQQEQEFNYKSHLREGFQTISPNQTTDLIYTENGLMLMGVAIMLTPHKNCLGLRYPMMLRRVPQGGYTFGPVEGNLPLQDLYVTNQGITAYGQLPQGMKNMYSQQATLYHGLTEEGMRKYMEHVNPSEAPEVEEKEGGEA